MFAERFANFRRDNSIYSIYFVSVESIFHRRRDGVSIRRVSIDRGFRSGQMDFHRHSRTPTLLPRKFLPSPPLPRRIHSYAETALKASRWRVHFSAIGVDGMSVTDGLARVDTHFSIKSPADELYRLIKQAKVTSSSQN